MHILFEKILRDNLPEGLQRDFIELQEYYDTGFRLKNIVVIWYISFYNLRVVYIFLRLKR